jgi:ParB-like chromosome segregation protein Spo0J
MDSVLIDIANVRKHDSSNLNAICDSLRRFGQQKPIVIDGEGVIRAGNGTYLAAKSMGWQEIKVVRTSLVGQEAVAYAIADNRTTDLSEFDTASLESALMSLDELDGTGFLASDLEALAAKPELAELKQVKIQPPPPMTWILIGIPTVRFGSIASEVEAIASIHDTIVETTSNSDDRKD